jgi:hypothetical protein
MRHRWLVLALAGAAFALAACSGDDDDGGSGLDCQPGEPGCVLRQVVHWHADIAMYINGEAFDFGDPAYLSTEDEELSENVHVHDPRHSVVHVHREQSTWDEFFRSLGMKVTDFCITLADGTEYCEVEGGENQLTFVVNGVLVDSIREMDLADLQRTLIWYGPEEPDVVLAEWPSRVTDQACIPSGNCIARAPLTPELEPCSVFNETCN